MPYLDVCDDTEYSQRAKQLHAKAAAAGVPAITTAGIYPGLCVHTRVHAHHVASGMCIQVLAFARFPLPCAHPPTPLLPSSLYGLPASLPTGVSNVMAAHMVAINGGEYNEDFSYAGKPFVRALGPNDASGTAGSTSGQAAGCSCGGGSACPRCRPAPAHNMPGLAVPYAARDMQHRQQQRAMACNAPETINVPRPSTALQTLQLLMAAAQAACSTLTSRQVCSWAGGWQKASGGTGCCGGSWGDSQGPRRLGRISAAAAAVAPPCWSAAQPRARRACTNSSRAGTGGAGPTIMETTLLLAGEDVVAYKWVAEQC